MSENLTQKLQNLENLEFPKGLHGKIMRKLVFLKFRVPFFTVVGLLALNLVASGWHIWLNLKENGSIETLQMVFGGWEWSFSFLKEILSTFSELFPLSLITSFVLNVFLVLYISYFFFKMNKLSPKQT